MKTKQEYNAWIKRKKNHFRGLFERNEKAYKNLESVNKNEIKKGKKKRR